MKKFLSIQFNAIQHPMSENPVESGWYIVRMKSGGLAWCFYFDTKKGGRWDWEEDLSNPADTSRFQSWHTPDVGGSFQNVIIEQL